jgi:hypothetical protein
MDVFSESSQTNDTTQPEIQATESTQPQDSFVQKLVEAKGDNWKDPEVLAKGKIEADGYIKELEGQLSNMREDLSKQDYAKDLLEQLQNKAADTTNAKNAMPNNDTGGTSEGNTNPSLSEEDLKSLVERTLTERDKDSVVKQNLNLVNNEMEKSYGTDASTKIQNKAKELGLTLERMQEIAAESPTAFFNLIGEPKKDFRPMVEGSVRTEGVNMQASNERDWSYYQNLRRDNRSLYYSPKIQRQLMEDKSRLGGKFGI